MYISCFSTIRMLSTRHFNGRPRTHVRYFIVKLVLACSLVCFGRTFPPCRDKMDKHRVGSSRKDSNKILYIKDEYYWYFLHHQTFITNDTFHYFQDFCNVEKRNENFHIACINFFLAFFFSRWKAFLQFLICSLGYRIHFNMLSMITKQV